MSAVFFFFGAAMMLAGTLLPSIRTKLGNLREIWAGVLLGAQSVGYFSAVLIAGILADRWGHKTVLLSGTIICGVAMVGFGWTDSYPLAMAMLMLFGVGGGALEVVPNAAIMQLGPLKSARYLNLTHLFFGLGAAVGPLVASAAFATGTHWKWVFTGAAGGFVALGAMTVVCVFPQVRPQGSSPRGGLRTVLVSPIALALGLLLAVYVGVEIGAANWLTQYLESVHDAPKVFAALTASTYWFALAAGRLVFVFIAHRASEGKLIYAMSVAAIVLLSCAVATTNRWTAAVCFPLAIFCLGSTYPMAMAWAGRIFTHRAGTVVGVLAFGGAAGAAVLPWIMSVIADLTDSLRIGMAFYILLAVLLLPCIYLVARLERSR